METAKKGPARKPPDLVGKRFGKLVVQSWSDYRYGQHIWNCLCDCGRTSNTATSQRLTTGRTVSCGCMRERKGPQSPLWQGCTKLPAAYWNALCYRAKRMGIGVLLTAQEADALYVQQGGECALSGAPIWFGATAKSETTALLDRIDSTCPYQLGNVQWVHKDVNKES